MLLVVNAGSSSLKLAVYTSPDSEAVDAVSIEGIGSTHATLLPNSSFDETTAQPAQTPDHHTAAVQALTWLKTRTPNLPITAIGYRVVHGGERYHEPTLITSDVLDYLRSLIPLAPNHMPSAIDCIEAMQQLYPEARHVASFDTGFFAQLPKLARTLPIPRAITAEGVRRYGFHGISYQYILNDFRHHEGEVAARGRVVMAHLGSGCSLTACKDGQPIDTTMGFTPISGVPMSTRTGDIEPGVLLYLLREKGMSPEEIAHMVTAESGLLGISDDTADMYYLLQHQAKNPDAALAVDYFCYAIRKQIGAYAAILGGIDSIIFAGGIGERSAEIRARSLSGLEFLGIYLDTPANEQNARLISSPGSGVGVHVIPTHEDRMIAQQTISIHNERNV